MNLLDHCCRLMSRRHQLIDIYPPASHCTHARPTPIVLALVVLAVIVLALAVVVLAVFIPLLSLLSYMSLLSLRPHFVAFEVVAIGHCPVSLPSLLS